MMKRRILMLVFAVCAMSQIAASQAIKAQSTLDSVVTVYTVADGKEVIAGSGIILSTNGFILTPLHIIKNATSISIKIHNGEIFDNAKLVNKDERRNVAILQVVASGLKPLPNRIADDSSIGMGVSIVSNSTGASSKTNEGTLSGIQLADGIVGAGTGYRVFSFESSSTENLVGGLLLDDRGRSIGIVTTNPNVKLQNIAVPLSSISALLAASNIDSKVVSSGTQSIYEAKPSTSKPIEIKALNEDGTPVRKTARDVLRTAKTIYVKSKTSYIKDPAFIAELMKNPDFNEWGWTFVNNRENADLILEVDRLGWVIKFTFKVYSIKHGVIIASGNKHTNDFDFGSPDLVREIIRRLKIEFAMNK
jgi:Trypsin-like peptidase domain